MSKNVNRIKIIGGIILAVFVLVEFVLIVLLVFGDLPDKIFKIQLIVTSGVIMVSFNLSMVCLYFKYTGMPYKSDRHY